MNIAVFSDTHGKLHNLKAAMEKAGNVDAIIHLGDYEKDAEKIAAATGCRVYSVRGNCDFYGNGPEELVIELEGVKILCTHGHRYQDFSLLYRAQELGCSIALCGHTHVPSLENNGGTFLLNPGSLSAPRFGSKPGFGMLYLENGKKYAQLFSV